MGETPDALDCVCTVCIANYNGMGIIDECIRSVVEQQHDFPMELIVHDDASTDGSAAHIRSRYPQVRLIESKENVGFCVANNRMVAAARGKYVLLLNNDAALLPDALQTLKLESDSSDKPAILSLPQYDALTGSLIDRGALLDPFLNSVPNLEVGVRDVAMVAGSCLWIPRDLWQQLGGFPEWFGSVAEDLYLCCRARLGGNAVRVAVGSGYRHRVGASLGGGLVRNDRLVTTWRRRRLSERNKAFVAAVMWPWPWVSIALTGHLGILLIEGTLLAAMRRESRYLTEIYLPVLRALWTEKEHLRLMRKDVQASRTIGVIAFLKRFVPYPQKAVMFWRHGLPQLS